MFIPSRPGALVFALLLASLAVAPSAEAQGVLPTLDCWDYDAAQNSLTAMFGYVSAEANTVAIPLGAQNYFTPAPPFRGQPTSFEPGVHTRVFSATFSAASSLDWTLAGTTVHVANDWSVPHVPCTGGAACWDLDGDALCAAAEDTNQDGHCDSLDCPDPVSLLVTTAVGPGAECPGGGVRVDAGVDDDVDGVLDASEIDATVYFCDPAPALDAGVDGGPIDPAVPSDAGAAGGAGGGAGGGTAGGAGGGAGGGPGGDAGGGPGDPGSPGAGCGCGVAGADDGSPLATTLVLVAAGLLALRRRSSRR